VSPIVDSIIAIESNNIHAEEAPTTKGEEKEVFPSPLFSSATFCTCIAMIYNDQDISPKYDFF
jgi:hypothetical protein